MHHAFKRVVNAIGEAGWGQEFTSDQAAQKSLVDSPETLTAFALVELLARLKAFAGTTADTRETCEKSEIGKGSKCLPDARIGDILYTFSLYEGAFKYVVIGKGPKGECFVVDSCEVPATKNERRPYGWWIGTGGYSTLKEAMVEELTEEAKNLTKQLEYCREALSAVTGDGDLAPYTDGYDAHMATSEAE